MNPLGKLPEALEELLEGFMSHTVVGNGVFGLTNYVFWMLVATLCLLVIMFAFKKKQAQNLVPKGFFVNAVESLVEFIKENLCKTILGPTWRNHFPFVAALFLFILMNSIIGIIPGGHPGTGTIGVTAALGVCSFVYFVYMGCRRLGVAGYIKSMAPHGVGFPINALVWVIELFSTFLRLVTLSVRLFCNMFAGHVVMGTFAILASLFVEPLLQAFSVTALAHAGASIFWLILLLMIYAVEIMVGVIQAYVFALLSSVYIQLVEEDEE